MFRTRGSSIEAPGAGSVAWVAKGNKIIFDFVHLCPSTVPCLRGRLVRSTTRQFQKPHVVPDVSHDVEHAAMPDLTVHLRFSETPHGAISRSFFQQPPTVTHGAI